MFDFDLLRLKKHYLLIFLALTMGSLQAAPAAIIGGDNDFELYAAFVSPEGTTSALPGFPVGFGFIKSVSINASGNSIIGGEGGSGAYAVLVSSDGMITPLSGPDPIAGGTINAVAINSFGSGIIGGSQMLGNVSYAALVSSSGVRTPLSGPAPVERAHIVSVAINSSGNAIIGGTQSNGVDPYVALVSAAGVRSPLSGFTPMGQGEVFSVAIIDSGISVAGGSHNGGDPYAVLVSPSGAASSLIGLPAEGRIRSVAINPSGNGIIGGASFSPFRSYAALFSSSGTLTELSGPGDSVGSGQIYSVAINSSGNAIIGGEHNGSDYPYAVLVSASGVRTPLSGNVPVGLGRINSVAIDEYGSSIIGGYHLDDDTPYAAIVSPLGVATALSGPGIFGPEGEIRSVSVRNLSHIATASLSGNNLIFANYINQNAPQNAFYFIPSLINGSLNDALESAVPTRNAFSSFATGNNLFYLTSNFSNYMRNQQSKPRAAAQLSVSSEAKSSKLEDQLVASESLSDLLGPKTQGTVQENKSNNPYTIWFELIGAFAYQQAQDQTPAFNPSTGGAILATDVILNNNARIGGGVSYLFTHIHQSEGAGHSNINQEILFACASWNNQNYYAYGCLSGGPFQISQVRNIQMTGFSFKSVSDPNGGNLSPHVELGYIHTMQNQKQSWEMSFSPFGMIDWANIWQGSYRERGDGPFNVGQKGQYSSLLRTEVGLRTTQNLFFSWGDLVFADLIFQEKASYVNVQSFSSGNVTAFLVGSPGSFTVQTLTSAQNLGVIQFAMSLLPYNRRYPTSSVFYQGEFGPGFQSHQVNLGASWVF